MASGFLELGPGVSGLGSRVESLGLWNSDS